MSSTHLSTSFMRLSMSPALYFSVPIQHRSLISVSVRCLAGAAALAVAEGAAGDDAVAGAARFDVALPAAQAARAASRPASVRTVAICRPVRAIERAATRGMAIMRARFLRPRMAAGRRRSDSDKDCVA